MIRDARVSDVESIAALAHVTRLAYAAAQPQFWRPAEHAVNAHTPYLVSLIDDDAVVALVATDVDELTGYLVATMVAPPPVYDPGGPTGMIDDFAVASPELWPTVGAELLEEATDRLRARGAAQLVVVTGHHDSVKREVLLAAGLIVASEWFVHPLVR
jgi:GNAT superfamily N-acetyltransferase